MFSDIKKNVPFITNTAKDDIQLLPLTSQRKRTRCLLPLLLILAAICVVMIIFVIGVAIGYSNITTNSQKDSICSNPPVLIVSLDGFRFDYLQRGVTPNIQQLANDGVLAQYMTPVFPSQTFPNHYTIVTGLYPESHGIVANKFYSRTFQERFTYTVQSTILNPKWWLGEPVWVTANKQNLITAAYFWPGSEVPGMTPDIWFKYDRTVLFDERVNTVLSWFDFPEQTRPQFMAMYLNEPDYTAHKYGPNATQVNEVLVKVDNAIAQLVEGLKKRDIYNCVNLIVVSDHGMATVFNDSVYTFYPEILSQQYSNELVNSTFGVISQLYVKNTSDTNNLFNIIKQNITKLNAELEVYLRDDVPEDFHFGHYNQDRYGDIIIISRLHAFLKKQANIPPNVQIGQHGYNNSQPLMRALFMSHGPAFKTNYRAGPVQSIDIYELMCRVLNINPAPNNGSLTREIGNVLKHN